MSLNVYTFEEVESCSSFSGSSFFVSMMAKSELPSFRCYEPKNREEGRWTRSHLLLLLHPSLSMTISSSSSSRDENRSTVTETTPLLPQPQAEETAPVQSSTTSLEHEPLSWSQLVPALASLWLILFLAAADGTIGQ